DPGKPHVEQDEIDAAANHPLEAGFAGRNRFDAVSLVAQHAGERLSHTRFVVYDQDGGLHRRFIMLGSSATFAASTQNAVPARTRIQTEDTESSLNQIRSVISVRVSDLRGTAFSNPGRPLAGLQHGNSIVKRAPL